MQLGQLSADAQAATGVAILAQALEGLKNLMRCFEEDRGYGLLSEFSKKSSAFSFLVGWKTGEEESTTGLTSSAERGRQGAWAGQAVDGNPECMAFADQLPAWIGNAGCSRVTDQSAGTALLHVFQEFALNAIGGVFPI